MAVFQLTVGKFPLSPCISSSSFPTKTQPPGGILELWLESRHPWASWTLRRHLFQAFLMPMGTLSPKRGRGWPKATQWATQSSHLYFTANCARSCAPGGGGQPQCSDLFGKRGRYLPSKHNQNEGLGQPHREKKKNKNWPSNSIKEQKVKN